MDNVVVLVGVHPRLADRHYRGGPVIVCQPKYKNFVAIEDGFIDVLLQLNLSTASDLKIPVIRMILLKKILIYEVSMLVPFSTPKANGIL